MRSTYAGADGDTTYCLGAGILMCEDRMSPNWGTPGEVTTSEVTARDTAVGANAQRIRMDVQVRQEKSLACICNRLCRCVCG